MVHKRPSTLLLPLVTTAAAALLLSGCASPSTPPPDAKQTSVSSSPGTSATAQPSASAPPAAQPASGCSADLLERTGPAAAGETITEATPADLTAYLGFDLGTPACVLHHQGANGSDQWDAWFTDSTADTRTALVQGLAARGMGYDGTLDDFLSQTDAAFNKAFWIEGSPTLYGTIYWGATGPSTDDTALIILSKH